MLNDILLDSRKVFKRASTHRWFVIIIVALMVGQEHIGVTSIIRELWLDPRHYDALLHFFRSTAWELKNLRNWWIEVVKRIGVLYLENGMPVLVGDGTKKSKEGKKMPCVKRLRQESEDTSKPSYIFGHMFGMVGVLAGGIGKLFCVPLSINIHDGDEKIIQWDAEPKEVINESHVVRIIRAASQAAKRLGKSLLLLDAYYLSVPALVALQEEARAAGHELISLVVRAKRNATAYEKPVRKSGRGRPPKKGESVNLMKWRNNSEEARTQTTVMMYGKEEVVSFISRDLLWGQKHYQLLRFVVAQVSAANPIILVSTDFTLSPEQILRLYSYRFKIECCFFNLKHTLAGFAYRFWCTVMPKLDRYAKSGTDALETVSRDRDKRLIMATFRATQGYVMMAGIAVGLLQIGSLLHANEINTSPLRWLRTNRNVIPSEASTADFMRRTILKHIASSPSFGIIRLIQQLQCSTAQSKNHGAA